MRRLLLASLLLCGCSSPGPKKPAAPGAWIALEETVDGETTDAGYARSAFTEALISEGYAVVDRVDRAEAKLFGKGTTQKVDPPAGFKGFTSYRARVTARLMKGGVVVATAEADAGALDTNPQIAAAESIASAARAVSADLFGGKAVSKDEPLARYESDVEVPPAARPPDPKKFALVMGVEAYAQLPHARFAERDAQAAARHFEALGVPPRNLVLITGPLAVRSAVEKYVEEWLPKNAGPGSTVYVYFSGHGAPKPETGAAYLLPWDGDPSYLERTAYPLERLYAKLGALKAKRTVVMLDSCFSGAGGRSLLPRGTRPLVSVAAAPKLPPSVTVLAASGPSEITGVLEARGHGLFTYWLLKGLPSAKTAKGLLDFVTPKVQDEARRQNREQTPALLGRDAPLSL